MKLNLIKAEWTGYVTNVMSSNRYGEDVASGGYVAYRILGAQVGKLTLLQDHHVLPDGVQVRHDLLQSDLLTHVIDCDLISLISNLL